MYLSIDISDWITKPRFFAVIWRDNVRININATVWIIEILWIKKEILRFIWINR